MKRFLQYTTQSSVIGLVGGVSLVLGMMLLAPESAGAFINLPGLIVVLGGTLAATAVSRPIKDVVRVLRLLPALLRDHTPSMEQDLQQLLTFADYYRRGAIRVAEQYLGTITNPTLKAGLRQIVDNCSSDDLARLIEYRISGQHHRGQSQVQILRTMAVFAPAFGMLGTLFGLVHMLYGLGSSGIAEIGTAMGFAMITTLYGIVAANLFLKPLAMKLERRHQQQLALLQMLAEGMLLVRERRHPTLILEALESFPGAARVPAQDRVPLNVASAA